MLGVIIALEEEVNTLLNTKIKDYSIHYINNYKFYIFKSLCNESVVLTFCGVGKTNAAIASTLLINNFNVNKIINIGSCASVNENLLTNDILLVDKCSYGDVDLTPFNYEINQLPKMPQFFNCDFSLKNNIQEIIDASKLKYHLGNVFTIDSFIDNNNLNKFNIIINNNIVSGVDMELCAIAQTCHIFKVKFASLKIVSDQVINSKLTNQKQYNNNISNVANIIDCLVYDIIQLITYKDKK